MELVLAEQGDLDFIASWLQAEDNAYKAHRAADPYSDDFAKGFWCNWSVISKSFARRELEVVRVDGAAVAFHLGQFHAPGITEVHPAFRGKGIGTAIVKQVLQRALANEVCLLHVKCISDKSQKFWSKFGFVPEEEFSEDYYKVLCHPLPLTRHPENTVTVNFFDEMGWYTKGAPYKRLEIPCVLENGQILLSEICHDATVGSEARGDRRVEVLLDGRVIFDGWLGSEATAFGFMDGEHYARIAKRFNLPVTSDLT